MAYFINPGMDVKFQVTTSFDNFLMAENPFRIIIKDQYGRPVKTIRKEDGFWDKDDRFYFVLEKMRRGIYYAYFTGSYDDEDFDDQCATVSDIQELLRVPGSIHGCPCQSGDNILYCNCHRVHYEFVTTVDIDGDECLCGSDGKYILTSDGYRICFKDGIRKQTKDMAKVYLETMTAKEFKQFIEGRNPNGTIDTVPELMDAANGINEGDGTIKEEIDTEVQSSEVERVTPEDLSNFEI